jgi:phenylpyruvate tautomerase PptA (4-oxalocrotonate tautomerase family)
MPVTRIESCRERSLDEVAALRQAVYEAQVEALKVPEDDFQVRFLAYPPGHFPPPPGRSDNYLIVEYTLFPGRSVTAKRALIEGTARRLASLGVAPSDLLQIIHEPPLTNWGLTGARLASDGGVGFSTDV